MTANTEQRSPAVRFRIEDRLLNVVYPGARLALWLMFYLSILLGGWVLLGVGLGGWTPVVVTSGSMEPAVSVGDVLLIDKTPGDTIGQRSIVVFDRADGTTVAHRVFSVEGEQLVTKGDANPSPDTDRVATTEVRGVARVLVPLIGLPAVWRDQGDIAPLLAWALLSLAGAFHFVLSATPLLRNRIRRDPGTAEIGQVGLRRVRVLVGVLIIAQFAIDPSRFELLGRSGGQVPLLIGLLTVLLTTNVLSVRLQSVHWKQRLPMIELGIDTVLVVFLSTLTGSGGLGWVLFALPIIEAAVRFGLIGALNHWMILTTLTVAARIWSFEVIGSSNLLEELEQTLDQMSVLFLVVVPGAYLAEQLIGDVAAQRRATAQALASSGLLKQVAQSSRIVSQLDGQHIDAVLEGARRLGFDVVDLVACTGGEWRKLDGSREWHIPEPGHHGSGLLPEHQRFPAMLVDGDSDEEREALEQADLAAVVTSTVASSETARAVFRAGVRTGRSLTAGEIDAFRLLAGQAAVALQNHELLTEITSIHGQLVHQAHHDALTGLPNRVRMLEDLEQAIAADPRPAVMFLDLDGFKPVNDRLGHDAGDELLRQVAARLCAAAPRDSLVARVGGDEFTILLRGALNEQRTIEIANGIVSAVEQIFVVNDDNVRISTSIGVAFGEDGAGATELIRRADVAMYVAKNAGDECPFEFYRPDFDLAEDRRAHLAEDIGGAIARDEIKLVYQPVFHATGGTTTGGQVIAGVEALVRWTHPMLGVVPPPETIRAAKSAQLGAELHRHISATATRTVASWLRQIGDRPFFLSINASPEDLVSNHIVSNLSDAITTSGLSPHRVFIEISEQLVSPDIPGVMENIHALNRTGIRMLLDDFGEGQTSISYIHELPVAGVKLDRKLVVNALRSKTDRIVIETVVDLCRRLGLVAIAEGVETEEHLDIARASGCNMVQGYHMGLPAPGPDVLALLRRDGLVEEVSG